MKSFPNLKSRIFSGEFLLAGFEDFKILELLKIMKVGNWRMFLFEILFLQNMKIIVCHTMIPVDP